MINLKIEEYQNIKHKDNLKDKNNDENIRE